VSNIENESRAQFEAWASANGIDTSLAIMHLTHPPKFHKFGNQQAQHAWEGWQASRQALVIDIEPDEPEDEGAAYLHQDFVRSRIESQGVKCK
jgi:hypothetical protein